MGKHSNESEHQSGPGRATERAIESRIDAEGVMTLPSIAVVTSDEGDTAVREAADAAEECQWAQLGAAAKAVRA